MPLTETVWPFAALITTLSELNFSKIGSKRFVCFSLISLATSVVAVSEKQLLNDELEVLRRIPWAKSIQRNSSRPTGMAEAILEISVVTSSSIAIWF